MTNTVVDFNELYGVQSIKSILYDREDEAFYLLCNKKNGFIGFYLYKFSERNPKDFTILTSWRHNLSIGDANIFLSRGYTKKKKPFKELICGYKTIYINTYNTVVLDLGAVIHKGRQTIYKHEAFQLWESNISGLLLKVSKEFITFTKSGMNILGLGIHETRSFKDNNGNDKTLHSLDSLNYLKVDP